MPKTVQNRTIVSLLLNVNRMSYTFC